MKRCNMKKTKFNENVDKFLSNDKEGITKLHVPETVNVTKPMLKEFEANINNWADGRDRIALRNIYNMILKKHWNNVRNRIDNLDTVVRDQIPVKLYDAIFASYT